MLSKTPNDRVKRVRNSGTVERTSINDVRCFLAIFDLPTYLVLPYNKQDRRNVFQHGGLEGPREHISKRSVLTMLKYIPAVLYNVQFWGLSWTPPLPTLISDVTNGRSFVRSTEAGVALHL